MRVILHVLGTNQNHHAAALAVTLLLPSVCVTDSAVWRLGRYTRRFDTQPLSSQVATLGKSFTHISASITKLHNLIPAKGRCALRLGR